MEISSLPTSLDILSRSPIIMLDAENFWSDLSISFNHNKKDRGRNAAIGISWEYNTIPSWHLFSHIPSLAGQDVDWTTVTFKTTKEVVVILHYCTLKYEPHWSLASYEQRQWITRIHVGVISESSSAISKLRLIGDQLIQAAAERHSKLTKKV